MANPSEFLMRGFNFIDGKYLKKIESIVFIKDNLTKNDGKNMQESHFLI